MEKLIYKRDGKITGTAGANYFGPEHWVTTPDNFNFDRIKDYKVVNGKIVAPNIFEILEDLLDDFVEQKAAERNYGSKYVSATSSLVGYENDAEPRYAAEAAIFKLWKSKLYTKCYWLLAQVQAGQIPMPASFEDVIPYLPVLNWDDYDIPTLSVLSTPPAPPTPPPPPPPPAPTPIPDPEPEPSPVTEPEPDPVVDTEPQEQEPEVQPEPVVEPDTVDDPVPTDEPVVDEPTEVPVDEPIVDPEEEPTDPPVEDTPVTDPVEPVTDPEEPEEPIVPAG